MAKPNKIIIFLLAIISFGMGVYLKDGVVRIYNDFNKQVQEFQKTDIGSVMTEVGKEILNPAPLKIGGASNKVVLVKSKIIEETNLQRQENNLPILTENKQLADAAAAKANDMFLKQYFEHVSPDGIDPSILVKNYGYEYIVTGENLILGNFEDENEVVADWMASPGHRANILNNRFTEIGVAVIKGTFNGETVWIGVQEFGLPLSTCSQPDSVLKNRIEANKATLENLASQIESKKAEISSTTPGSVYYQQMIEDYNQLVNEYNPLAETTKELISQYNAGVNIYNSCVKGE